MEFLQAEEFPNFHWQLTNLIPIQVQLHELQQMTDFWLQPRELVATTK
jgi:hypothetical protein